MALPKEPRQKMINMMYLVLTALLALNVSSEILNAFKVVNNSITTSNNIITEKNALTYKSFENKAKDPQTAANAQKWQPKALKAKQISDEMFNYIAGLQLQLKKEADLQIKDGVEHFREDNLDATTRLFDKKGEGKKLYEKLSQYKVDMLALLNPAEFVNESPQLQAEIKKARNEFEKSLPIDVTVPKSQAGNQLTNDAKGWTTNYFHMTPTIAGLTILSKFQNDVKNSESQMVDYFHKKIGEVVVVYDKFQVIATSNTTYAMPGEDIEITAGVGAFSAAAKPSITIAGQPQALTADGTAIWKAKAAGSGMKSVDVIVEYTKPDGSKERTTKTIKYEVGQPSGVAVSADKMNVLYIGVDNPLTITAGVGSEKINASFSAGTIKKDGGSHWTAVPRNGTMGEQFINVIIEGKSSPIKFRVKRLPDPGTFIGAKRGGSISAAEFKATGGIIARLIDSDFDAPFKVVSYQFGAIGGPFPIYQIASNDGNRWNGKAKEIIDRAGPGTSVFFDKIIVVGPDGVNRELPTMSFNLK